MADKDPHLHAREQFVQAIQTRLTSLTGSGLLYKSKDDFVGRLKNLQTNLNLGITINKDKYAWQIGTISDLTTKKPITSDTPIKFNEAMVLAIVLKIDHKHLQNFLRSVQNYNAALPRDDDEEDGQTYAKNLWKQTDYKKIEQEKLRDTLAESDPLVGIAPIPEFHAIPTNPDPDQNHTVTSTNDNAAQGAATEDSIASSVGDGGVAASNNDNVSDQSAAAGTPGTDGSTASNAEDATEESTLQKKTRQSDDSGARTRNRHTQSVTNPAKFTRNTKFVSRIAAPITTSPSPPFTPDYERLGVQIDDRRISLTKPLEKIKRDKTLFFYDEMSHYMRMLFNLSTSQGIVTGIRPANLLAPDSAPDFNYNEAAVLAVALNLNAEETRNFLEAAKNYSATRAGTDTTDSEYNYQWYHPPNQLDVDKLRKCFSQLFSFESKQLDLKGLSEWLNAGNGGGKRQITGEASVIPSPEGALCGTALIPAVEAALPAPAFNPEVPAPPTIDELLDRGMDKNLLGISNIGDVIRKQLQAVLAAQEAVADAKGDPEIEQQASVALLQALIDTKPVMSDPSNHLNDNTDDIEETPHPAVFDKKQPTQSPRDLPDYTIQNLVEKIVYDPGLRDTVLKFISKKPQAIIKQAEMALAGESPNREQIAFNTFTLLWVNAFPTISHLSRAIGSGISQDALRDWTKKESLNFDTLVRGVDRIADETMPGQAKPVKLAAANIMMGLPWSKPKNFQERMQYAIEHKQSAEEFLRFFRYQERKQIKNAWQEKNQTRSEDYSAITAFHDYLCQGLPADLSFPYGSLTSMLHESHVPEAPLLNHFAQRVGASTDNKEEMAFFRKLMIGYPCRTKEEEQAAVAKASTAIKDAPSRELRKKAIGSFKHSLLRREGFKYRKELAQAMYDLAVERKIIDSESPIDGKRIDYVLGELIYKGYGLTHINAKIADIIATYAFPDDTTARDDCINALVGRNLDKRAGCAVG